MASLQHFSEIEAWQKARELTRVVYECSKSGKFAKDYGLREQICRAAVSIMSNIAEGFERGGKSEFLQFLSIARGSAAEVESQLYVALDQGYISENEFDDLQKLTRTIVRLLTGFTNYLKASPHRGNKYKDREP